MTTPKLQMPELVVGQAGKELTHNQAIAVLDQLAQAVVVDKDLAAPPGSPANGSMYIVATGATGAWAGHDGKLAYWLSTVAAWTFITPADGWCLWVADEAVRYERKSGSWFVVATGGGSLVNFAENLSTSSPNAVTYASRLLPASPGATDIDFVIEPKGGGALLRKIPDGTAAGGAKRGSRATDLQASRSAASQVASGADSFAAGADNTASGAWSCAVGYSNTASGGYSVVFGYGNLAQQAACVALGQSNSATGSQSVAIGNNNTASGGVAFALGNGCEASGTSAFAMGATCTASGSYSQATGRQSTSRGVIGAKAHSSGQQSTLGDAQTLQLVSRAATTDATSTRLTADNTAASAINQVLIPTNSAVKFRGDVVARNMANGECATWSVSGLIKNVEGTVTLVGTPTATMDLNDTGAAGWTLTITADNTNKSLAITVVGAAATSIRWVSSINTTEVTS